MRFRPLWLVQQHPGTCAAFDERLVDGGGVALAIMRDRELMESIPQSERLGIVVLAHFLTGPHLGGRKPARKSRLNGLSFVTSIRLDMGISSRLNRATSSKTAPPAAPRSTPRRKEVVGSTGFTCSTPPPFPPKGGWSSGATTLQYPLVERRQNHL